MITLRQRIVCVLLVLLTFAVLVGAYIASGLTVQYDVTVGNICPEDIFATRNIVDNLTTRERKNAAAESVENVYTVDFGAVDLSVETVTKALTQLRTIRERKNAAALLGDEFTLPKNETYLSDNVYTLMLNISLSSFDFIAEHTPIILQRIMTEGVMDKNEGVKDFNEQFASLSASSESVKTLAEKLCMGAISVNKTVDMEETENRKALAAASVSNVTYMKNQIIARRGEIITPAQYEMLKELGFVKGSIQIDLFHTVSVVSLLLLVIALVIVYYFTIGRKEIAPNIVITTTICSILTSIGAVISLFGTKMGENTMYLMPLALIPALISLLLSGNLASVVNVVTAVFAGILTNDMSITLSLIIAGCATAYVFSRVRRRSHLLYATAFAAVAYALSYSAILIDTSKSIFDVFIIFSYSLLGGFFGGILTIGTIPFWEAFFDVITPMKLGELSNPEHKLLKKLLLNAPGTYHHSLTVANMADAAADAIGANALLARVGAYYHDIGKMENPMYFKENQFGIENPHDELPYEESAAILLKHVSSGYALSGQYRLPTAVRNIILQHHGTTTASYFLYKARQENPDVDVSLFTYPGPTPTTKEATIIMLADACEAAVRAMREKGAVDSEKVVSDIISSRIAEGQLSLSPLTFSDLEMIKASFVKTLDQYFHKRVIYPHLVKGCKKLRFLWLK